MLTILNKSNPVCQSCTACRSSHPLDSLLPPELIGPSGNGSIPLLVLTGAPENNDFDKSGYSSALNPKTPSGLVFLKSCSIAGVPKESVWQWNMIKCATGRADNLDHMTACQTHLDHFVEKYQPKAIYAMGDAPIKWLTGYSGKKQSHEHVRGYILDNQRYSGIPVVGGLDPAYVLKRNKPILKRTIAHDLKLAVKLAQAGGKFARPDTSRWELFPSIESLKAMYQHYKDNPSAPIYYDIETAESVLTEENNLRATASGSVYQVSEAEQDTDPDQLGADELPWDDAEPVPAGASLLTSRTMITQIQFATNIADWAVTYQWVPEVVYWVDRIFALPNLRVNVNRRVFDDPILRAHGIALFDHGLDLMDLWHRYEPDLPKGLGFITPYYWPITKPWKHLHASEPGVYGCADVISLQKIHPVLVKQCEGAGIWTSFQVHDMQLGPAFDRISARGNPVDVERKNKLGAVLDRYVRILKTKMGKIYPENLLPVDKASEYKEKPEKLKQAYTADDLVLVDREVEEELEVIDIRSIKGKVPTPEVLDLAGQPWDPAHPQIKWLKKKVIKTGKMVVEPRWMYRKKFNQNSRDQVLAYLEAKRTEEWMAYRAKDATFCARYPDALTPPAPTDTDAPAPRGWKSNHVWFIPANPREREFKAWVSAKGLKRLTVKLKAAGMEDPLLPLIINATSKGKMKSSFVDTWCPGPDGRVHTTFKFSPATPQMATVDPNILAGPKHGTLAKKWRRCLRADEPRRWVMADYGGFHAITTGYLAEDRSYIYAARIDIHGILGYIAENLPDAARLKQGLLDPSAMSREEITDRVKVWARKNGPVLNGMSFKERRDEIYKRCIAEGSLVLTDKGLVKIENVTLDHKVWDGVEWVSHEGIIDQGIRSVISYDGITATPDHIVFTADGRDIPLGRAASELVRLERTGFGRTPIRTVHRDLLRDSARRRIQESSLPLSMRPGEMGSNQLSVERRQSRVQGLRANILSIPRYSWPTLRRNFKSMFKTVRSGMEQIRRSWHTQQIQIAPRFCAVGGVKLAPPYIQRRGDRSDRQQWSLRTWKFAIGNEKRANSKSIQHKVADISKQADVSVGLWPNFVSLLHGSNKCSSSTWSYRRADNSTGCGSSVDSGQKVEDSSSTLKTARTFDILNAGPRRCFTVNDCLVANCILGVQLGCGAYTMYMNAPEIWGNKAKAEAIIEEEKRIWPKVFAYHEKTRALCSNPPYRSLNEYGYLRRYTEVMKTVYNEKLERFEQKPGPDSEKCLAADVQAIAFGHIRDGIIYFDKTICEKTGLRLADKYGLVNNIHDSLEFWCPDEYVEELTELLPRVLQRRSRILVSPTCPEGLWCQVEVSVGQLREGQHTCKEIKTPLEPFDFPIEHLVGWPESVLKR